MKITVDKFATLRDHFTGRPQLLSPFWLAKVEGPHLGFTGDGVKENADGCILDLGTGMLEDQQQRWVRVENLGQEAIAVTLESIVHEGLEVRWRDGGEEAWLDRGGGFAILENLYRREAAAASCWAELLAETADGSRKIFRIEARFGTEKAYALGEFDFNGCGEPSSHDFGTVSPLEGAVSPDPYVLTIGGQGSKPLRVTMADLPDWLTLEVDGFSRQGPVSGRFFESEAPLRIGFRPTPSFRLLGRREAVITIETNDSRPLFQEIALELKAAIEVTSPCVSAAGPPRLVVLEPGVRTCEVGFFNWSREPARLEIQSKSSELGVGFLPRVPGTSAGAPGEARAEVTIETESLLPGVHDLGVVFRVPDGSPETVTVAIEVAVVRVDFEPALLDFGQLAPGESHRLLVDVRSTGGEPDLAARALPGSGDALRVEVLANRRLEVVCSIPPNGALGPGSYQEPAIEIYDEELGFRQAIPVRFRVVSPFRRRLLLLCVVLVGIALLVLVLSVLTV